MYVAFYLSEQITIMLLMCALSNHRKNAQRASTYSERDDMHTFGIRSIKVVTRQVITSSHFY